jgi:WD40 repeat protein
VCPATARAADNTAAVISLAYSPDGKTLAAGIYGGIMLWEVSVGKERGVLSLKGHCPACLSFSRDGKYLAAAGMGGGYEGTLRVWELATGKNVHQLTGPDKVHLGLVAYSPAGKAVAAAGSDRIVRLWDAATRKELGQLRTEPISAFLYLPGGKALATGSADTSVLLWDVSRLTGE